MTVGKGIATAGVAASVAAVCIINPEFVKDAAVFVVVAFFMLVALVAL